HHQPAASDHHVHHHDHDSGADHHDLLNHHDHLHDDHDYLHQLDHYEHHHEHSGAEHHDHDLLLHNDDLLLDDDAAADHHVVHHHDFHHDDHDYPHHHDHDQPEDHHPLPYPLHHSSLHHHHNDSAAAHHHHAHPHDHHHYDHDYLHHLDGEHHHEHSGANHHDHADHDHHDAHVRNDDQLDTVCGVRHPHGEQDWSNIRENASAPYINDTLLPMASRAEQYHNPPGNHPSEPNYLWLEAGTNFGIRDDNSPASNHQKTTRHLVSLLNAAGVSWKAYQEDISSNACPLTDQGSYVVKHDPFVFFDDVTGSNNPADAYCIAHVRPYSELATDLSNNTVARYNFITPNVCHDMHDSCAPLNDEV